MHGQSPSTPAELVAAIARLLEDGAMAEAVDLADEAAAEHPASAIVQHAAGLAHERRFLERQASGEPADLRDIEDAAEAYRRAADAEPEAFEHQERLFACLFILATQREDLALLGEVEDLADTLQNSDAPEARRDAFSREAAIAGAARARITQQEADWKRAEHLFLLAADPPDGREAFFFHYYEGIVLHRLGTMLADPGRLRRAARAFHFTVLDQPRPALKFLLADCLLQLPDPSDAEKDAAKALAQDLGVDQAAPGDPPADPLLASLAERWSVYRKIHFPDAEA